MSKHVKQLLHAYYDGELNPWQAEQVEAHLEECEDCRKELEGLNQLSDLLHSVPDLEEAASPEDFLRQVQRKVDTSPRQSNWRRGFWMSWQLAPLGMMLVLVFLQTTAQLTNLVTMLGLIGGERMGDGVSLLENRISAGLPIVLPNFGVNTVGGLPWGNLGIGAMLGFDLAFNLTLPAMISLLAVSWLAGWWVAQQNHKDPETEK